MRIDRRQLLLIAAAAVAAGCGSRVELGASTSLASSPELDIGDDDVDAPESVAMVGDSITAGSQPVLEAMLTSMGFTDVTISAEPGRRIDVRGSLLHSGIGAVSDIAERDAPDLWVIALGTNDAGLYAEISDYEGLVRALLEDIPDDAPVVWIDVYRDDHIEGSEEFNEALRSVLDERGNATVGRWYARCNNSNGDILSDGVHPDKQGVDEFADCVRVAIRERYA